MSISTYYSGTIYAEQYAASSTLLISGNTIQLDAPLTNVTGTIKVNNLQNISGTRINLTASSLVVAQGTNLGFKHTKGLFTTGYTVHTFIGSTINYSLPQNIYVLIAQISDPVNSCTISLPTNPLDGETHTIKGLHIGSSTASMKIATAATNAFEGGKQASPLSLTVSSSAANLRAITAMYVASKLSWYILNNYKD